MRQISKSLLPIFFLLCAFISGAQAQEIVEAEYFIDNDPGAGMGVPVAGLVVGATIDHNLDVDVSGLPSGFHFLLFRVKNENGEWGVVTRAPFFVSPLSANTPESSILFRIAQAEYFFDVDPGVGKASPLYTPATANIESQYDISIDGLAPGPHKLGLRVRDGFGQWGVIQSTAFTVKASQCIVPIVSFAADTVNAGTPTTFTNTS